MKFIENIPIYLQIINIIKIRIIQGKYKLGDKLPSVRELSTELKVNPNTIQRAYSELDIERLVFIKRGMGTFITRDYDKINNLKSEMLQEITKEFLKKLEDMNVSVDEGIEIIKKIGRV